MKKSGRKLLGILLTASIIATTVFPMQSKAAEGIGNGMISETQKKEESTAQGKMPETTVSANILPTEEMGDALIMPASYDINQPVIESFELEENGQTLTKNDTLHFKMLAYDADRDIRSIIVQISKTNGGNLHNITFQKGDGDLYTATFACSKLTGYEGDYYVSKIRLEDETNNYVEMATRADGKPVYSFTVTNSRSLAVTDFQMQKNASDADGNLRVGDTVTYTAHVECEGMELGNNALMYLKTLKNGSSRTTNVSMRYNAETKTLTGTYTVDVTTCPSEWELFYIYIRAENISYSFYPSQIEPDKDLKFTVINDDYDEDKPVIESITIDKNEQMVKAGETVTVKVKVNEKNPSTTMSVRFSPKESGISSMSYTLYLNKNTMEYTGSFRITNDTYPTRWELTSLSVGDTYGNYAYLSDFREDWNTTRPWYFTVDPEGYLNDTKAPVIKSITIDKNGQWVYPGDTVTITVKVDEENPASAYAYFYPQVSYVSGYNYVTLRYDASVGGFVGTIPITENTYPCEWMLTSLTVYDVKGHYATLSNFKPDWQETCPWYYRVKTDDTYREDVEDATFSVYGLASQQDGSFQYGYLIKNETIKIERRSCLKDLSIWPSPPAEGVNVKWRESGSGQEVDEDTELFFRGASNRSYNFYASYDKSCVNVILTYVSKDDGIKMAVVPQFVDKGATYGEMLDSMTLPEDADKEFLTGFKLDASFNEKAQVEDTAYVVAEATYQDCLVAWNTKYLDKDGNEVSKIVSQSYTKGTTINNALAELEKPEAPDGLEFEKWALPMIDGGETLSQEMVNLNVTAVYKGKTTVDVSYTYRGEDGKLASGNKLMALDGENLSYAAVLEKAAEALKEVKHLDGLMLSGWKNIPGIDHARYKTANVRAQYGNCVVILKYPNDAYEYVVVEKDSGFTLPVENEKYIDVLWEGYGKGETVTITGDREFLAADVKLKDGSTEEPSGGKLPEEEIDQIIADIGQSGNGETIHINMRKATVVPKEVLEAIQGKEVNIVLDMGTYSWSIDGNEVDATNLKDIDLEVIVDTHEIPPSIVNSLAEGNPATQITLIHDGDFGFRADLTVNLGSQHSGSTGRLYYYDSAGKLIYIDAGEIGADGNISLSFSHASDYVVIIEKASSDSGDENNDANNDKDDDTNNDKNEDADINADNDENNDGNGNENGDGSSGGSHSSNSGQGSGGQETISIVKWEDSAISNADAKNENDSGKPKSPKTGE